jgi:hypothetical protein
MLQWILRRFRRAPKATPSPLETHPGLTLHRERFICPATFAMADCVLVKHHPARRWLGVLRCSETADPATHTQCDQACVRALNAGK